MFARFGKFAQKYKYYILAFWLAFTVFMFIQAPVLSEVGVTDQSQFLPSQTESVYARNLVTEKFATTSSAGSIIVVYNPTGLTDEDMADARALHDWLLSGQGTQYVDFVASVYENEALKASLISQDQTTMLINVGFSTEVLNDVKQDIIAIREEFTQYPNTIFYFTGSEGFLNDLFESVQRTIDKSTWVTLILVVVLLLFIYRSPIAALVPLLAIGMSFLVTRGVIGYLAQAGISFSTVTDAYIVVTIFGVGTDYCLFIISRFREEMGQREQKPGIETTMKRIGPVILASAVTVVIAFLCLSVSKFEMTRTSGLALAIGIGVTLLVGLTLVPSLMAIFGKKLFWPSKTMGAVKQIPSPVKAKKGWISWDKIGAWVSQHPLWVAIPIIMLLVLPYIAIPRLTLSANVLTQLSEEEESSKGLNVIREHFPVGELSPMVLLIQSEEGSMYTPETLVAIDAVTQDLSNTADISRVQYPSVPAKELIATSAQIKSLGDMILTPNFNSTMLSSLSPLSTQLEQLALNYSGIVYSQNFNQAMGNLQYISTLSGQLAVTPQAELPVLLYQLQSEVYNLSDSLAGLGNEFAFNSTGIFSNWLKSVYFSIDYSIARIYLIPSVDPYSNEASLAVPRIRDEVKTAVAAAGIENADVYVGGDTAMYADMLTTSNDDLTIVIIVTSVGIMAVIFLLLRSLVASIYMVITVLLNYGATLGITAWIFQDLLGYKNLINMLPVFLFVILAAVGADYNIFLVSRIREETETRSIKEAVHNAVAHTGNVITSCGIILAGTFATLASSSFPMVAEIGVAIAIGIIIDTFVVRALLVPSLATLFGRWGWWPSKLFKTLKNK
ncbi:MAG: MMPL family transporter [Dehalococcoidales bacterium]|nr:MMPL family transporter [Dehalococcoidales bacterium]